MWTERQTDLHLQIYTLGLQLSIHKLHAGHIITIIIFIARQLQFSDKEEETWRALWEEETVAFFYLLTSMPCHGIQEIQSTDYIVVIIMQRHANTFTHGFQACKVNYSIESAKQSNRRQFLCQFSGWNFLKNVLKEFDAQLSKLDKEFTKAACKQFADPLHNPEMNLQYAQSITGKSWRLLLMHPYHEDPPASSEFFFSMD